MFAYIAYGLVVIIWSTTPLAIQWSNSDLSFSAAVLLRMSVALVLALLVIALMRRRLPMDRKALTVYAIASLGIFPNMPLVYWSAQFIPSGLISLVFGTLPFVTAALSYLLLKEEAFNARRVLSLLVAIAGLGVICLDQLQLGADALYGVLGILASTLLFAGNSLALKQLGEDLDALSQTTGALLFSLPGLFALWFYLDGELPEAPEAIGTKSLVGVGYLAVMGSLLGFTLFYFVLQRFAVETVSLVSLMTPVFALAIGAWVQGEALSARLLLGAFLVLGAMVLYQGNLYLAPFRRVRHRLRVLNRRLLGKRLLKKRLLIKRWLRVRRRPLEVAAVSPEESG